MTTIFQKNKMMRILIILLLFQCLLHAQPTPGAECTDEYLPLLMGKKVGLVVNHTSLIGNTHLADSLRTAGVDVRLIFAPEHGFRGTANAGELVKDGMDVRTGIPIKSLYGKSKKPSKKDLDNLDVVVFDIQDVGTRFFTYISTLLYIAEACSENDVALMVLDRPNPNGHYIDGPILEKPYESFIGTTPLPIVHGCTVGELARMYQGEHWIKKADKLRLTVVPVAFYDHQTYYAPPVKPSPNLPDMRSILLYPSICLFEGTKFSVGRGTDYPFQIFGAPDFEAGDTTFTPLPNAGATDPPHKGKRCIGFNLQSRPIDSLFAQGRLDLSWLLYCFEKSPRKDDFFLKTGFFNLLAGNRTLRVQVEQSMQEAEIRASWQAGLESYRILRRKYLLYP
jgi:uncharacterized protein YbbC (DUF1343 family)